jgi:hypothetical protein
MEASMTREVKIDEVGMVELKGPRGRRLGAVRLMLHTETTNRLLLEKAHPMLVRAMIKVMEAYAQSFNNAMVRVAEECEREN